jgi:RNA polymerase sigma factor FliA
MARASSRQRSATETAEQGNLTGPDLGVEALWQQYRHTRSPGLRNQLVEHYMPLVRATSNRIASELPSSVQIDDLISVGTFGLMNAIDRFDPEFGVRFESYCTVRIRGAILDELRSLNWMPRLQSSRAAKIDAATNQLTAESGRAPTHDEIARKTGMKVEDVRNVSQNASRQVSMSGSPAATKGGKQMRGIDILKSHRVADPFDVLSEKERRHILAREVDGLPKAQRLLVMLYYFDELTMRQIGDVLSVTESRVCQMHAGILDRLQQRLAELDESRSGGAAPG